MSAQPSNKNDRSHRVTVKYEKTAGEIWRFVASPQIDHSKLGIPDAFLGPELPVLRGPSRHHLHIQVSRPFRFLYG